MKVSGGHSTTFRRLLRLLLFISILHYSKGSDSQTLMKFKKSFTNGESVLATWTTSTTPCNRSRANWEGVLCFNDTVYGIKIEGKGLVGVVNAKALTKLPSLLLISLQNNSLEGALPDFTKSQRLRSIFLTGNKFSGEIPADAFYGMRWLKKIYLANNEFIGSIPLSLTMLPKLKELMLENNRFEGEIPQYEMDNLTDVNFANNHLHGIVPEGLQKFPASQFSGNPELCGPPLRQCKKRKASTATTIMIVLAVVAALAAITMGLMIIHQLGPSSTKSHQASGYRSTPSPDLDKMERGGGRALAAASTKRVYPALKLTFLRNDNDQFDLPDLLRASAKTLGGGVIGSSYKAILIHERVMVVKRFKHMNHVTKDEFVKHMKKLGKLNHPNLLPFIAFWDRKEEKLLVTNYIQNMNLAVHLHGGNKSSEIQTPDWPTRLKIVKGTAKGLLHLYNELPSHIAPHGHLKSSNVLLNQNFEPLLADYGLVPITNTQHARDRMIAYKSPEYKHHGRITKKTDVWSFGVLILEILTGKSPATTLNQDKGSDMDLENFVESMKNEELMLDVLDKEMGSVNKCNEEEMVKLLKIGLSCCQPDVDKRWDIKEVVERIDEVRGDDNNNNN